MGDPRRGDHIASVGRELGLFPAKGRKRLLAEAGRLLLEGKP